MDLLEFLRSLRPEEYDNNLVSGGPPRRPRLPPGPLVTKGDIKRAAAERDRLRREAEQFSRSPGARIREEPFSLRQFLPEYDNNLPGGGPPRAARLPQGTRVSPPARVAPETSGPLMDTDTLDSLTGPLRAFGGAARLPIDVGADLLRSGTHSALGLEEAEPGRYSGETAANLMGALEDTARPVRAGYGKVREGASAAMDAAREALIAQGARPRTAVPPQARDEDTELRRGVPAARGALDPAMNPGDIGGRVGDKRRLTPEQRLEILKAQLSDPDRNPAFESQLRSEIAMLERQIGKRIPAPGPQAAAPGALEADPWETGMAESAQQNAALGALGAGTGEPAAAGATATREPLAEAYRKKVAAIEKETGEKLTDQQRAELRLDFFLRLMSAGTKPGATLLGAAGEGGLQTSALSRGMREKNMAAAAKKRTEAREDVFREIGFSDKDADNASRDRQLGITEEHYKNLDRRDIERLDLLRQQVEAGKWQIKETDQGLVAIDTKTNTVKPLVGTDDKPLRGKPAENANITFYKWLMDDPKRIELFLGSKGRTLTMEDTITKAIELVKGSAGQFTLDQAMEQVRRAAGGGGGDAEPPRFNSPAELEQAKKTGRVKKGDRVMTPEGARIVR